MATFAQGTQPKHIVSIGTDGFGWSGLTRVFDWDKDKSGIKNHEATESKLNLNYNYVLPNRLMLGAILTVESDSSEIKETNGDKTKSESSETELGLSLGYNFNEDINNSWWVQGVLSSGKYEQKTKDSTDTETFDYDYSAFYLNAGRRISLDSWGLKNVSYNPSISIASAKLSGDAESAGVERAGMFKLEIIKFDILFRNLLFETT